MAMMSSKGPAVTDSEEAEILACRQALEFAIDAGFVDLVVEGDCPVGLVSVGEHL